MFLFKWKLNDFCNSRDPNTYDLLRALLAFGVAARVPSGYTQIPAKIATLTGLEDKFKSTPGMNVPTSLPQGLARPTPSPSGLWWERTLVFGDPIPTEYLAQVPPKWPYTEYGMGVKVGTTTKWPLTDVNRTESTVAWVYASVLWNPRPLFTRVPEGRTVSEGEVWQTLLGGWTQGFITAETSTTAVAVGRTRSENTASMTMTSMGESESESTSSMRSSMTLEISKGIRPSVTQSAVLSKDTDGGDVVSGSASVASLSSVSQDIKTRTDMGGRGIKRFAFPTTRMDSIEPI